MSVSGLAPSAMLCHRLMHRSTNGCSVNTQNRPSTTASATRSATLAGGIASSMAFWTCGTVTSAANDGGGCSPRLAGQLREASMMLVRTQPGHTTLTPMGRPARIIDLYRPSEMATTACLDASYDGAKPGYSPAMLAVLTKCPPPWLSICGRKARMPWMTPHRLTPSTHFQEEIGPNHGSATLSTPALLHTTCAA